MTGTVGCRTTHRARDTSREIDRCHLLICSLRIISLLPMKHWEISTYLTQLTIAGRLALSARTDSGPPVTPFPIGTGGEA